MKTTITQFRQLAKDANGNTVPLGDVCVGEETKTAAGAFAALGGGCRFIRIWTDTAISHNLYGTGKATPMAANTAEYFPAREGQIITTTAL